MLKEARKCVEQKSWVMEEREDGMNGEMQKKEIWQMRSMYYLANTYRINKTLRVLYKRKCQEVKKNVHELIRKVNER